MSKLLVTLSVIASIALLGGCGGLSRPFGKGSNAPVAALYDQAPPVTIVAANGIPGQKRTALTQYVAAAAKQRGFTVNNKAPNKRGYRMAGQLTAQNTARGTIIIYVWDVTDPIGSARHRITGQEIIPIDGDPNISPASGNAWSQVGPDAIGRIAARTAEGLATYLGQNGFYVRHVGLPPPDSPPVSTARQTARATDPNAAAKAPITPSVTASGPAVTASAPVATGTVAATAIKRSVAVPAVKGVDKASSEQLVAAIRLALGRQGFNVEGKPDKKALKVAGSISLGAKTGGQQPVSVHWKVIDSKGTLVGTVKQNNKLPAGALDTGWGPIAQVVADAASGGIIDLLVRAR